MLTPLLAGTKYKIPQNGYERVVLSDRVSINEEQQLQ
ncbi:unnamed protein product, partial [Rotaria magnacalcarata]